LIFERLSVKDVGLLGEIDLAFGAQLNVLFGDNESGKTTIAEAIFGALYGSRDTSGAKSKPRHEIERLEPWEGGAFRVGVDLLLDDGRRLSITRRLGQKKGDLTVFDPVLSADVAEDLTGGRDLGEALFGVPAGLFRDSFFIPQMALAPSSGSGAMERIANLQDTGREDTSYVEAVKILDSALTRLGKSDTGAATLIGKAKAAVDELETRLADSIQRRGALFEAEHRVEEMKRRVLDGEGRLAELEGRLAGARKREALSRLSAIEEARRRQADVKRRLEEIASVAALDPHHRRYVRAELDQVEGEIESREEEMARLTAEIEAAEAPARIPGENWAQRARDILDGLEAIHGPRRGGIGWGVWVALALFVIAVGGALTLKEGPLPLALLIPAIVFGLIGRRQLPRAVAQELRDLEVRKIAAADEAGLKDLTPEAIEEVSIRLEAHAKRQASATRRAEIAVELEQLRSRREALAREIEGWQDGADDSSIDMARRESLELRQAETDLLLELDRLQGTPIPELEVWAQHPGPLDDGSPVEIQNAMSDLKLELHGQRERLAQLTDEIASRLAEIEDTVDLGRDLGQAMDEYDRLRARREALILAGDKLKAASEDYRRRIAPSLAKGVGVWLKALTAGRYETASVDEGIRPRVQAADGAYHPPEDLSQGARDLVYLALRLALVEQLPGEVSPIILDDPCVNMDRGRTRRVMSALGELALRRQVLYLTCHEREAELAAAAGARVFRAPWTEDTEVGLLGN